MAEAETYNEALRPQFHFSPMKNWTNDPNGLVFLDGVSPVLPAQSRGDQLGQHDVGTRRQPRPRPLDAARPRDLSRRTRHDLLRIRRRRREQHRRIPDRRPEGHRRDLHVARPRSKAGSKASHAEHRIQQRLRPHVGEVRRQPRARPRHRRQPRPEGHLARADRQVGDGPLP